MPPYCRQHAGATAEALSSYFFDAALVGSEDRDEQGKCDQPGFLTMCLDGRASVPPLL